MPCSVCIITQDTPGFRTGAQKSPRILGAQSRKRPKTTRNSDPSKRGSVFLGGGLDWRLVRASSRRECPYPTAANKNALLLIMASPVWLVLCPALPLSRGLVSISATTVRRAAVSASSYTSRLAVPVLLYCIIRYTVPYSTCATVLPRHNHFHFHLWLWTCLYCGALSAPTCCITVFVSLLCTQYCSIHRARLVACCSEF
jgi:hypothetical protein